MLRIMFDDVVQDSYLDRHMYQLKVALRNSSLVWLCMLVRPNTHTFPCQDLRHLCPFRCRYDAVELVSWLVD